MHNFLYVFLCAVLIVLISHGMVDENFCRYKTFPMASATFGTNPGLCVNDNFANASLSRGTQGSLSEAIDEVIAELFTNKTAFIGGGNVASYFYQGFLDIWNSGMRDDFLSLRNSNTKFELWVTGHSLVAAMASLCAGYIASMGFIPGDKIKLVTYGQPRTGDGTYANFIDKNIPYAYRIIHKQDPVPHLPPLALETGDLSNYTHHKSEIWYNNDMTVGQPYLECDENESAFCSDQLESDLIGLLLFQDHLYYYNVTAWFAENGCPGWNSDHKLN